MKRRDVRLPGPSLCRELKTAFSNAANRISFCRKMRQQRQRMDYFAQQLINGVVLGSIYGLIAIGYTMVYGIVGMINFAHGDIFMIGGFIALISFLILVSIGLTVVPVILLIVLLVSMAITALYGWG